MTTIEALSETTERLRSLAQEKYGQSITTHATLWEDDDIQIEVYHTWVEDIHGDHHHDTTGEEYDEIAVKRRWFESWVCSSDGELSRQVSYQFGDAPIYSKERHNEESESLGATSASGGKRT